MRWWMRRMVKIFAVFLLIAGVMLFMLRRKYDIVIVELTRTQVTNSTSDLINDAIAEQILKGKIEYDRIVYFEILQELYVAA